MKTLWNIRGIVNPPSRLALKRLKFLHNPNFLFIVEPKISFDKLQCNWFLKLGYNYFAFNNSSLPSLWCFFKIDIDLILMGSFDQFVAFSFLLNHMPLAIIEVYASNNLYKRKELWEDLNELQIDHLLPCTFIQDFNAIMGAHEHYGCTL